MSSNARKYLSVVLVSEDLFYNFTYRRTVDSGFMPQNGEIVPAQQAILDIDGHINEENLTAIKFGTELEATNAAIRKLNDIYMFELFKQSMSKKFLNQKLNETKSNS